MSYKALYEHCQGLTAPVRRNDIRDKLLEVTGLEQIRYVCMELNPEVCRGLYLSPRNKRNPWVRQLGCPIIVLARGLEKTLSRFVCVKEMMHAFDDPTEQTDGGEKFDEQINEISGAGKLSCPQARSEAKAFWMAIGVLCPEKRRLELKEAYADGNGKVTEIDISLAFRIPQMYVRHLINSNYEEAIKVLIK